MIDAYELQQKLFDAWRELSMPNPDPSAVHKKWPRVPVYVDGKVVKDIIIHEHKILLVTDDE